MLIAPLYYSSFPFCIRVNLNMQGHSKIVPAMIHRMIRRACPYANREDLTCHRERRLYLHDPGEAL